MELSRSGSGNPALEALIAERVRTLGSIDFAEFMTLALYHPRYGYYLACDPSLDYQSSPNVHPVFGAALARQLAAFWRALEEPPRFDVFEAGAGDGRLAGDVLRYLRQAEPQLYAALRYVIQDAAYAHRDPSRLLEDAGLSSDKVTVATDLPAAGSIEGCILSNELLDALPFRRVRRRAGRLYELRVGLDGERFVDVEAPPAAAIEAYFDALGLLPGEGCDAEVLLETPRWLASAAGALRRGYLLTLDYGYEAAALYAAWRRRGTLLTFYRHTSGDDPYVRIGRQDITASVDLTTLRRAGEAAGLQTIFDMSQTEWLAQLGIGEALARPQQASEVEAFYALRRAVIELTDASGLGRIRVLAQAKDAPGEIDARC
jgi:SAM-dependent MidA family methyltransferase